MANYYTYFSEYTTGVQPSDWSARWVTTNSTWTKQADDGTGTIQDARLRHTATVDGRRLLSWDDIDVDANRDDVEILARVQSTNISSFQESIVLRGSGAAASETGYSVFFSAGTGLQLFKFVAGTASQVGSTISFNWTASTWYWIRFRANGTALKVKVWAGEHESEPSAWSLEITDASIAAAGWVGLGASESNGTRSYDAIAIGTNGDTAAFPVSPEARVTQQATMVLSAADSDARVTQAAVLVLAELGGVDVRITQATLLALAEFDAGIRVTQTTVLVLADQVNCLTRWAQTWTITRTDGEVFAFTSLDRPLTFRGVVHEPCNSLMASAVELSTIVGVTGSMELRGILADGGVSEVDLYNGLFDGARIEVWMVPWDNAGGEIPFRLMAGVTGSSGHGDTDFSQEILTPSAQLGQRALLETFTPACRYEFGSSVDPRCPVDLAALTVTGSATGLPIPNASTNATRRIFTDSTRVEADGFFNLGSLTWTSGLNIGATSEVKDFTAGQFILWEALLYPIALTDAYSLTPSCDKSPAGHLQFNADMVDFGGFPDVPGGDALVATPDSRG